MKINITFGYCRLNTKAKCRKDPIACTRLRCDRSLSLSTQTSKNQALNEIIRNWVEIKMTCLSTRIATMWGLSVSAGSVSSLTNSEVFLSKCSHAFLCYSEIQHLEIQTGQNLPTALCTCRAQNRCTPCCRLGPALPGTRRTPPSECSTSDTTRDALKEYIFENY